MYACFGMEMGRSRLLVLACFRLNIAVPISDPSPIVFVSLARAVACTMAFALSRSRGRRRRSTGCRIAKDQDAMITSTSIEPDGIELRLCAPQAKLDAFVVDLATLRALGVFEVGPQLVLDGVMCLGHVSR